MTNRAAAITTMDAIRAAVRAKEVRQVDLARRTGYSRASVSMHMRGRVNVPESAVMLYLRAIANLKGRDWLPAWSVRTAAEHAARARLDRQRERIEAREKVMRNGRNGFRKARSGARRVRGKG